MSKSPTAGWVLRLVCFVLAACPIALACGFVHPFHLCVGQMKWNPESKVWEVSLRLHPQDLEKAMSAELKKERGEAQIGVDDEHFPSVAIQYLNAHFYARRSPIAMKKLELQEIVEASKKKSWAAADAPSVDSGPSTSDSSIEASLLADKSSIKWMGMEQERGWLWMHFELTAPSFDPEKEKLWFVNRILIDSTERQENTLAIDPVSSKKFSLQFRAGEEFHEMKPPK